MNRMVVSETVQALKALRSGSHGKVEDGVAGELDQIIGELELLLQTRSGPDLAQRALELLGMAIELVGIVVGVMELTSR